MRLSQYKDLLQSVSAEPIRFNSEFYEKVIPFPITGKDSTKAHWSLVLNRPVSVEAAFLKYATGVFVDFGEYFTIPEPLSLADFVFQYSRNGGFQLTEYFTHFIPAPDITSPYGWATVSRKPLNIKAHYDLYVGNSKFIKK